MLLDATHKVCKYTIPLYLLVVQTNVNFQVVAVIVIEDETSELLSQAMEIVKSWNPSVNPKYAMIDFDAAEILSLEFIFPGIDVFLCDFHREQSWTRWIHKKENGVFNIGDDVLARLRRIGKANTMEECSRAVADLRSWEFFTTTKLQDYFENTWYPELTRWCRAYRPDDLFRCNTNNGTERLNESIKYQTLDGYKNCSLTELIQKLADTFSPDLYEKYISLNVKYSSGHKGYAPNIPKYMINRPGPLVEDMLQKLERVTPFMRDSVYPVTPCITPVFEVESIHEESNVRRMYTVSFGDANQICSCQCGSFRKDRLICKHFFAVFESSCPFGFGDLSPIYLNHPYTTIDRQVMGNIELESIDDNADSGPDMSDFDDSNLDEIIQPLPSRRKQRNDRQKQTVLSKLKVITDKVYSLNNQELQSDVESGLDDILAMIHHFEVSNHGHGELNVRDKDNTVPARRYPNDLCIYDKLPRTKGKRKHPFSGRYGEWAETMRQLFRVNVPLPRLPPSQSSLVTDGTIGLQDTDMLVFDDRDFEEEERLMQEEVIECVADMLDFVEDEIDNDDEFMF